MTGEAERAANEYAREIMERIVHDGAKDAWIGSWLVRGVRRQSALGVRVTFVADHAARVGCTADTPERCGELMATWEAGLEAVAA
jgi:type IV pilus biogenesis protein CpaD/CtpE